MKLLPNTLVPAALLPILSLTALAGGPCDPKEDMYGVSETVDIPVKHNKQVYGVKPGDCKTRLWTADGERQTGMRVPGDGEGSLVGLDDGNWEYRHELKGTALCRRLEDDVWCDEKFGYLGWRVTHCCKKIGDTLSGYRSGDNCGVHVRQVQKGSAKNKDYILEVWVYDHQQNKMGKKTGDTQVPAGVGLEVTSSLPMVLVVTPQKVDKDPLKFSYGNQFWESSSEGCSVGGYDKGERHMDCRFRC